MWMKARGSVRLRITVAATLVFALAFGVAAWAVVNAVQDRLEDQVREDAEAGAARIAQQLDMGVGLDRLDYVGTPGVTTFILDENDNIVGTVGGVGAGATRTFDRTILPPGR